jgi:predicted acylesterase/phospholipase RssA
MPLSVEVTRVKDGRRVAFDQAQNVSVGVREAVLASMSIYGVFPTVKIWGAEYADGGPRANLPLPWGWNKYDELYFLIAQRPIDYAHRSHGIPYRLLLNSDWRAMDQVLDTIAMARSFEKRREGPRVYVIWPEIGKEAGSLRFSHGLIREARDKTMEMLGGEKS